MHRTLHLRIMASDPIDVDDELGTRRGANTSVDDIVYRGVMAGECYISLEDGAAIHGQLLEIPLADNASSFSIAS